MSCQCHAQRQLSRRELLLRSANGFGAVALTTLMADQGLAVEATPTVARPLGPRPGHFAPRAKSVIFLYMDGGPSQVDTFDPKPRLTKEHGEPFTMKMEPTQFNNNGNNFGSPWKFRQY